MLVVNILQKQCECMPGETCTVARLVPLCSRTQQFPFGIKRSCDVHKQPHKTAHNRTRLRTAAHGSTRQHKACTVLHTVAHGRTHGHTRTHHVAESSHS